MTINWAQTSSFRLSFNKHHSFEDLKVKKSLRFVIFVTQKSIITDIKALSVSLKNWLFHKSQTNFVIAREFVWSTNNSAIKTIYNVLVFKLHSIIPLEFIIRIKSSLYSLVKFLMIFAKY